MRSTERLFRPGAWTRLHARLARPTLDAELSRGADPALCPLWAARAAELCRPEVRQRIADDVERVAGYADAAHGTSPIGPHRAALRANRDALTALARRLRDPGPVYAGGVAAVQVLMHDGAGPVYTDRDGAAIGRALQRVEAALSG